MKDQQEKKHNPLNTSKTSKTIDQRKIERRQRKCEGYTYIQMVGWIDRREMLRRDEDCLGG